MRKHSFIIFFLCIIAVIRAQTTPDSLTLSPGDTVTVFATETIKKSTESSGSNAITQYKYRNGDSPLGVKLAWGMLLNSAQNAAMMTALILGPSEISKWEHPDRLKWYMIKQKYQNAYTKPPVIDPDLWITNYIGHPYQGSLYFNTLRSQGSSFLESSVYNLAQSVLWEYVWEAGLEQPSIQDLIVTPIVGTIMGELSHRATAGMRRNGFNWYEKVLVCLINPYYAVFNGFSNRPSK